jgi:hypothetical protein
MGGACRTYTGQSRCPQGFAGKPEEKKLLGRPVSTWEVNIKIDFQEIV